MSKKSYCNEADCALMRCKDCKTAVLSPNNQFNGVCAECALLQCDKCSVDVPINEIITLSPLQREHVYEENVCTNCYNEITTTRRDLSETPNEEAECSFCSQIFDVDDLDERKMCPNCKGHYCDRCLDMTEADNLHSVSGEHVCKSCLYETEVEDCKHCNVTFYTKDLYDSVCMTCTSLYCNDCEELAIRLNEEGVCTVCQDESAREQQFHENPSYDREVNRTKICSQCLTPYRTTNETSQRCNVCVHITEKIIEKYDLMDEDTAPSKIISCVECGTNTKQIGLNKLCIPCSKKT